MKTINEIDEILLTIEKETMVLTYFTTNDCNLCKDLYPKVEKMLELFPNIIGVRGEADVEPAIVGQFGVFIVPTIILFVQGKETIRRSRTISIDETAGMIQRYYDMVFNIDE